MSRQWLRWLPALGWMVVIFVGSAQPVLPMVDGHANSGLFHKIGHVVEYAVLAWCLVWATGLHFRGLLTALALATLYAATDEYHQTFVPGRQGRIDQVVLDAVAAAGALVMAWVFIHPTRWANVRSGLRRPRIGSLSRGTGLMIRRSRG